MTITKDKVLVVGLLFKCPVGKDQYCKYRDLRIAFKENHGAVLNLLTDNDYFYMAKNHLTCSHNSL